jgi:polyribonucleotide nucleotidyltransferase
MIKTKVTAKVGNKEISIETGELAKQANGSVIVSSGDTVVLVTASAAKEAAGFLDFLPLTVNYQEQSYAAGKIPGGFFKREGKPSDRETLAASSLALPKLPVKRASCAS